MSTAQKTRAKLPKVARTLAGLRRIVAEWRAEGDTIALIPTMGALHAGHLALVAAGRKRCTRTVTSIFVNPTQFAPHEDFAKYPRTFPDDLAKLASVGGDLVWAPTVDIMYGDGDATRVVPDGAALGLESDFRPHFFKGVATVCNKLFNQVTPDLAVFGEKDYQQLAVIRQMVRDLDMPLAILGHATVREKDGLAMSSRNAYLSAAERAAAPTVWRTIRAVAKVAKTARGRTQPIEAAIAAGRVELSAAGFGPIDYLEVRDAVTLAPPDATTRKLRVLVAAWLGRTRLIDNCAVN
ncbi:MAG: pantoate--beta-alanine ligase [Hyphomicrobiaceae bacterium]